ncbi:MAG: endonuclease/exonuclease/phosphatase family protein [Bacteroidota bacterium]
MLSVNKSTLIALLFFVLFIRCNDLAFLEKEQSLIQYFNNDYSIPSESQDEFTILTYNIQMAFANNQSPFDAGNVGGSPEHLRQLAEALASVDPDFVALQDVGRNVSHSLIQDQIGFLAEALKMNYAYADYSEINTLNNPFVRGTRGHAFLSKYPIKDMDNIEILNQSRYDSRSCQIIEVELGPNQFITCLNTHFKGGASPQAKEWETDQIIKIINQTDNPILLAGDFNNTINASHIKRIDNLLPSVLTLADDEQRDLVNYQGTKGNPGNNNVIDNIFVDSSYFDILSIGIMDDQYWNLSDHRFLFATFSI